MALLRVLIVGAGPAGLCLAQGLRRAGAEVLICERDSSPTARGQGYRIHVAAEGTAALRACLPPDLYDLAVQTSGSHGAQGAVTLLSRDLEILHRTVIDLPQDHDDGSAGFTVDRLTLRQVLLAGLEHQVRFGAPIIGVERRVGGGIRARFGDGTTEEADLLVGADGASSGVRALALPQAEVVDQGEVLIFGKTYLTAEVRRLAPAAALEGFSTVVGPDRRYLPLAAIEYRTDPMVAARHRPDVRFTDPRPYLMWVLGSPHDRFASGELEAAQGDGEALRSLAEGAVADWNPRLPELVRRGDPSTVNSTSVRVAIKPEPWAPGPVTLVGDAIHCMRGSGIGAAVALRDAGLLAERLGAALDGRESITSAVAGYEREMLEYGFAAVEAAEAMANRFSQPAVPGPPEPEVLA